MSALQINFLESDGINLALARDLGHTSSLHKLFKTALIFLCLWLMLIRLSV
jgi:hypothetical protein